MTETRDDTVNWLTQDAYTRLKGELDYLSGPGRVVIAQVPPGPAFVRPIG